jgi:1,2-diacylglycerol 3-beta-galactosyltransferase
MKKIVMLMSDTGGGHRAAAEAIREALHRAYGADNMQVTLVDVFRTYSPYPFNKAPEFYTWLIKNSKSGWAIGYQILNSKQGAWLMRQFMYRYMNMQGGLDRLLDEHPADVIVSVHGLVSGPLMHALQRRPQRPPYLTVVTDLVSTFATWYDQRDDLCIVPTQGALERGIHYGMPAEKMRVIGLPVNPRFGDALKSKASARRELGWREDLTAILMVAGGDGMGPVYETAKAIDAKRLNCQLTVICGRNAELKARMDATPWNGVVRAEGFTTNMPTFMAAADVLITKGGPGTISEACIAGLPMIISDAIPGQETGNVEHIVKHNAGVFAPEPQKVADTLATWLSGGLDKLADLSQRAKQLATPNAAHQIAEMVWQYAHQAPIKHG